jgi:alcohol dehydrogenase
VVEVRATGVCRSDWHAWRGHDPVALPHVPGHEFAGVVARVGADVASWRPGDRVTAPFVCGCGVCAVCRAGDPQVCPGQTQPGFTHHGSFAEQVLVRAADFNLVRLPDAMSFVAAAGLGCRVATAYRALTAHGRLASGDWLAVHGCGGVGLSAVLLGRALGARVVAVDVSPAALDLARERGAAVVLDTSGVTDPADVAARVHEVTGGGAHVSLDALGSSSTAVASVLSLRRRGRHVQVGLLLGAAAAPPLPMDRVLAWELSLHGSHGIAAREYRDLLDLIDTAGLDPAALVGRVVPLDEAGSALAAMDGPTPAGMTVVALG